MPPPEEKVGGLQVVTLCNFVAEQESYYPLRIKLILALATLTNGLKLFFIKSVQEKLGTSINEKTVIHW